jgi:hypothetical protein
VVLDAACRSFMGHLMQSYPALCRTRGGSGNTVLRTLPHRQHELAGAGINAAVAATLLIAAVDRLVATARSSPLLRPPIPPRPPPNHTAEHTQVSCSVMSDAGKSTEPS